MSKIWVAPVGKLVQGHVLDASKVHLEETLRRYDNQLYLKWEPKKLRGHGCWELRRRPAEKIVKEVVLAPGGVQIQVLGYVENGLVSHIKDFAFLNYKILEWVQDPANDTWKQSYKAKNWASDFEYREAKAQEALDEKSDAERRYNIKQMKSEIRGIMEHINSGGDPNAIVDGWK